MISSTSPTNRGAAARALACTSSPLSADRPQPPSSGSGPERSPSASPGEHLFPHCRRTFTFFSFRQHVRPGRIMVWERRGTPRHGCPPKRRVHLSECPRGERHDLYVATRTIRHRDGLARPPRAAASGVARLARGRRGRRRRGHGGAYLRRGLGEPAGLVGPRHVGHGRRPAARLGRRRGLPGPARPRHRRRGPARRVRRSPRARSAEVGHHPDDRQRRDLRPAGDAARPCRGAAPAALRGHRRAALRRRRHVGARLGRRPVDPRGRTARPPRHPPDRMGPRGRRALAGRPHHPARGPADRLAGR